MRTLNLRSIVAQVTLFVGAASALALFYLSYRPGDFLPALIVLGLLMAGPWLFISLLPTLFVSDDRELRREILVNQITTTVSIVVILLATAVYIDFDVILFEQARHYYAAASRLLEEAAAAGRAWLDNAITVIVTMYHETIEPFISRFTP